MAPKRMSDLEYLKMSGVQKFFYDLLFFILSIPARLLALGGRIVGFLRKAVLAIYNEAADILLTFVHGDWKTRLSYLIMGFGCLARGQILRGLLFLGFEVIFIGYMALYGGVWLSKLTLTGLTATYTEIELVETASPIPGFPSATVEVPKTIYGDNTLQILIYGTMTLAFVLCFLYTWRVNVKQAGLSQKYLKEGRRLKTGKDDIQSLLDEQFHKSVLALPVIGIVLFTVMPIIMMIMVAFTNYDMNHTPPMNLFEWVGLDNFNQLFTWGNGSSTFSATFGELLCWTLIWAFFATFTNYFLGMIVAMMINKRGIKFKKMWRGILVLTIAIPQFISLLYISKLFADNGLINQWLLNAGWITQPLPFWTNPTWAKVMVILINIWVGIPYLMLIATGVLMNIPADLYESARIDGANPLQQYMSITLPYMLFVTGPYLLTSFTANMNNFNVIYLLTGGAPYTLPNSAGKTDLLITWLYRLTVTNNDYKTAAVVGIMVFVVVATISLVVYNFLPSMKNEEDFQ